MNDHVFRVNRLSHVNYISNVGIIFDDKVIIPAYSDSFIELMIIDRVWLVKKFTPFNSLCLLLGSFALFSVLFFCKLSLLGLALVAYPAIVLFVSSVMVNKAKYFLFVKTSRLEILKISVNPSEKEDAKQFVKFLSKSIRRKIKENSN